MCGIAGIWNASRVTDPTDRLARMLGAMQHRGPDGHGFMEYAGGAAGMVRLALVDPSDRGQQPMWSPDGRVAILFNGEVYNFREEKKRLEAMGHRFLSTTDTEVVLHLYLEHGLDLVNRMRGMYAVALFDWRGGGLEQPPCLTLLRGPFAIKPLYIARAPHDPRSIIFASEIRAMLASGLVVPAVDQQALAEYLSSGFVWQPNSIIEGVRMLEAGTLEVHEVGKPARVERFWALPAYQPRPESLEDAAARLRGVLDESIRLHALADAPVGAFLSGGVDSTAIVGLMRHHVSDLQTYTLRFPEFPGADESVEAADAARFLEVENTVVDITGDMVAKQLPRFARDLDQPSTDGLNTWLVSAAAAKDVKGVLSGLGGDEAFAGYPVTRRMNRYANTTFGRSQSLVAQTAASIVDLVPAGFLHRKLVSMAARRSPISAWCHVHSVFHWNSARRSVGLRQQGTDLDAHLDAAISPLIPGWRSETAIGQSYALDTRIYMMNQLLRDCDATSMAHSLELRVPFVDVCVADFARTCANHHKLLSTGRGGNQYAKSGSKRVLLHAVRDVLPRALADRPKRGFGLPTDRWLNSSLTSLVHEACSPEAVARRGLVDPAFTEPTYASYCRSETRSWPQIWALLILELWCREVLDAPAGAKASAGLRLEPRQVARLN